MNATADEPQGSHRRPLAAAAGIGAVRQAAAAAAAGSAAVALAAVATDAGQLAAVAGLLVAGLAGFGVRQSERLARLRSLLAAAEERGRVDPLTGTLNRAGATAVLEQRLAHRGPTEVVGVLSLDIDRLKAINDSIGHGAGDEVLRVVAARLASVLRTDDALGRVGGDEFVVVTSGLRSVGDLSRLAERILAELSTPIALGDRAQQVVTASIGIAYVLRGEAGAEGLLRDADVALDRAKDAGGARSVVFDAELRGAAQARLELERELRRAVSDGELAVQYQPIVSAATGVVEAVEALVRWRHPTRGLIPPAHFLAVASESGLIIDLGEQVLAAACSEAAAWSRSAGRAVTVTVNLAERQLVDSALLDTVDRVLAATGLPASQLELEIAEDLLAHRPDRHRVVLRELAARGVRLALDDFGTTRASLRQLRDLEVFSTVKVDRCLAADVVTDPVDRSVVAAVLALARSLGMDVVAEGVETADQAAVLADLGVTRLQGFWFHRPSEPAAIAPVLQGHLAVPRLADR